MVNCSADLNHLWNFGRRHHEDQFCENYFEFELVVKEEMPFKCISYMQLWQLFCSAEWNHLCNYGRGYYEKQFCEIILNFGQWLRR